MGKLKLNWIPDTNEVSGFRGNGLVAVAGHVTYQIVAVFMTDRLIARYRVRGRRWPRWTVLGTPTSITEATELCEAHHQRSDAANS